MMPWFIWNGKNSYGDFHLWISRLPKITRAKERYDSVDIPGRAGSLILLQGEDVYESYLREITVVTTNSNPKLQEVLNWLRGEGELIVVTEPERVYHGRIAAEVAFERIGNDLVQAKVAILVDPFKKRRHPESDKISITATDLQNNSGTVQVTVRNVGNVASKPQVSVTGSGSDVTVTIAGQAMTFSTLSGTIKVDCDAGIITKNGSIWAGTFTGDFWRIPVGSSTLTTSVPITVDPEWRWV